MPRQSMMVKQARVPGENHHPSRGNVLPSNRGGHLWVEEPGKHGNELVDRVFLSRPLHSQTIPLHDLYLSVIGHIILQFLSHIANGNVYLTYRQAL